jgi:hypothetical protein
MRGLTVDLEDHAGLPGLSQRNSQSRNDFPTSHAHDADNILTPLAEFFGEL